MLQQSDADDYVIGTGQTHSVAEFMDAAFEYAGLDKDTHLTTDQSLFRPTEVDVLVADPGKARKKMGWKAHVGYDDLVRIMVDADMRAFGLEAIGEGDEILARRFPEKWWKGD